VASLCLAVTSWGSCHVSSRVLLELLGASGVKRLLKRPWSKDGVEYWLLLKEVVRSLVRHGVTRPCRASEGGRAGQMATTIG
jgi:hypothetical protein